MLLPLNRLFRQYCDHHYAITQQGFPIVDGDGVSLGHVDRITYARASVRLEGWSTAEKVAFGAPGRAAWQKPDVKRSDVANALKLDTKVRTGFNLVWHGIQKGLIVSFRSGPTTLQIVCPGPSKRVKLKADILIRANFCKDLFHALPALASAYFRPNPSSKSRAKRALRMRVDRERFILDPKFFNPTKTVLATEKITIVMPVFNAFDVLKEALQRIEKHTDTPWRLILIEDKSTDERVLPMLLDWIEKARKRQLEITLLENSRNLGFVQSVNRGFQEALRHNEHVVLLNSDALVPKGWAARLLHPIAMNTRVASVTPLSNDAELSSVPIMCKRGDLVKGEADLIDRKLWQTISCDVFEKAPTGVGFCMAINHRFLSKIPTFDRVFGKGYGEEVDWCQRTRAIGGQHVLQPNLFVEHRGAASFGVATKRQAIINGNQIISERYPNFDQSVWDFTASDPLRTVRLFSACLLLSTRQEHVQIFIAHSLGGGAELYLKEQIQLLRSTGRGALVLRVGGPSRWRIEAHLEDGFVYGDTDNDDLVLQFVAGIQNSQIVYSCGVGALDPVALPSILIEIVQRNKSTFKFLVHDFFVVSPSYCLLDSDDVFRPERLPQNLDSAHVTADRKGAPISAQIWRKNWLSLLEVATTIECFSDSSAKILKEAFPKLKAQISVRRHTLPIVRSVRKLNRRDPMTLGILGDIGIQKGAKCVEALAKVIPTSKLEKIALIGSLDPRFLLGKTDIETGAYQRSDIAKLAEQHNISAWLIPSIWPETFSYTTHEALATGLPVFCFDLGAQEEAVKSAKNGWILPLAWTDKPNLILNAIEKVLCDDTTGRRFNSTFEKAWRRGSAA